MPPFERLPPPKGTRVEVYWNLHKDCWSLRNCKTGRVVYHFCAGTRADVLLEDVQWVVQPAGNARVRRERRKNVHAFARGTFAGVQPMWPVSWGRSPRANRARYNPYKNTTFVTNEGEPILTSRAAIFYILPEGKPCALALDRDLPTPDKETP